MPSKVPLKNFPAVILNGSYSVFKRKSCWHTISSARRECWKEGTIAVSLVLSARLHKIRSVEGGGPSALSPPTDYIEEGERIKAFWTVFILDNCWTTADGSPSNFLCTSPHSRIDLP
ncbi:hypothetical protein ARMGADRAFT_755933 [Armillaria gallica]|uniref:Transcription factor domain-containing protein n=1 Tax=Armillaria gallica TaxID=47427 RepID=A0A2H3E5Z0_ARMGA|nr:hypothetical protein ARMGADRAFT_755933 [Armillaria gallica]